MMSSRYSGIMWPRAEKIIGIGVSEYYYSISWCAIGLQISPFFSFCIASKILISILDTVPSTDHESITYHPPNNRDIMERSRVISTDAVSGSRSKVCNSLLCYRHVLIQYLSSAPITHLSSAHITQYNNSAFNIQIKCEYKQQCCQLSIQRQQSTATTFNKHCLGNGIDEEQLMLSYLTAIAYGFVK
jgi:hypothetical protein